jgi:bifunctional DNase/RNase
VSDTPSASGTDGPADVPARDASGSDAVAEGSVAPLVTPPDHPTFVVMEVVHVVFELPSPSPLLVLQEADVPHRTLEFPIGLPEGQSIAMAIAHERPPRPGAHELLVAVLRAAACDVIAVRLTTEHGGTIHAELDLQGPRGHEVLDCRPTDGIAVALRLAVPAPILAEVGLLER